MLGAGRAEQLDALSEEEHDCPQVDVELQIDELGLVLAGARADAYSSAVDQHVEAPEALAVAVHYLSDRLLVRHVAGHLLDFETLAAQLLRRLVERVRLAGGERQTEPLGTERLGEGEADSPGGSGDDGGAVGHSGTFRRRGWSEQSNAVDRDPAAQTLLSYRSRRAEHLPQGTGRARLPLPA